MFVCLPVVAPRYAVQQDDLFDLIPSVQVPKGAYAHTYVPYNKPDAITKWFEKTGLLDFCV